MYDDMTAEKLKEIIDEVFKDYKPIIPNYIITPAQLKAFDEAIKKEIKNKY